MEEELSTALKALKAMKKRDEEIGEAAKSLAKSVNLLVGVVTEAHGVNQNAISMAGRELTSAQEKLQVLWPDEPAIPPEPLVAWGAGG